MKPKKIVVTGGPGTGKTAIVKNLEDFGHICRHEVIREMTLAASENLDPNQVITNPLVFVDDPKKFNHVLLQARLEQFHQSIITEQDHIFFDRGLPDVLAYMDYFGQKYNTEYITTCRENWYDQVFILPPWEEIYTSDNERHETFEQAIEIYHHLKNRYQKLGYAFTEVPFGSVAKRTQFILENI